MESFTNDKGEVVVIAEMDNARLIHSIAKYSQIDGVNATVEYANAVKAMKAEAIKRLSVNSNNSL